jgi:aminoglycoside phosphotransferase
MRLAGGVGGRALLGAIVVTALLALLHLVCRSVDTVALDDGRCVELGELTCNGSKNETRFGRIGRLRVVVKIQGAHGRLMDEERALRFLAAHGVRVPRVVGAGVTPEGRRFLAISREEGVRPITPAGWVRCGRDLAALLDVPASGCPLPCVTTAEFVADHHQRLDLVRPLMTDDLAGQIAHAVTLISGVDRLVVTHGDPGSGNYLDNEAGYGVLLDWETASVSPFGVDLGRAAFIGLLDLGRSGIPDQLVAALIHGYSKASPGDTHMSTELLRAWITIGGLQFIHGRQTQPLLPERTPQVAARVLEIYLASSR